MSIKEGGKAPLFSLKANGDKTINLADYVGKQVVVLYFYPKDQTSGCTREACDFRDCREEFMNAAAVVLGISPDSAKSHDRFVEKEGLTFPLLADEDHAVSEQYGAWKEKSMYGRKYMGIERSTFIIDKDGNIAKAWHKVKVPGHAQEVLEFVKALR